MSNLIKDRIINLSNNELFEMIKNKRDYQASAVEFAIEELSNRGFKDKTARVLIEVEKINKKNFKQDYKDSLKESERRKSSSKFWSMFFIYIAVNILLIFITMQSNNPATKEAGMKGIIGGNMLLIIGWVFSLFSKKKYNNLDEIKEEQSEINYECIHCGYIQSTEFEFCPACKKNDAGSLNEFDEFVEQKK